MAKIYKCPNCKSVLVKSSDDRFFVNYDCPNKDCKFYKKPKSKLQRKIQNWKVHFRDSWIYRNVIFRILKLVSPHWYKFLFRNLKTKVKYGVWIKEYSACEYSTCKYAVKLIRAALASQDLAWPEGFKSLQDWNEHLVDCLEHLEDLILHFNDFEKWQKIHGTYREVRPMICLPYDKDGKRIVVTDYTAAEEKKLQKAYEKEDEVILADRNWLIWFANHAWEI